MEFLYIILTALGSILVLFVLAKLMGNKQMSQLTLFDYINGITIGSIAAEMATSLEEFWKPLTAMIVYTGVVLLFTLLSAKSMPLRRLLAGRSIILLENGKLYKKNLARARIELGEFLSQCRIKGYFNIADIQTAVIEPNGHISILPRAMSRPATPRDLSLAPEQDKAPFAVILDGKVMMKNLSALGRDMNFLEKELAAQGVKSVRGVFYASLDPSGSLSVYSSPSDFPKNDIFA